MATFKITTPEGTFKVTAPDEESAMAALQEQANAKPEVGMGEDMARSASTGLRAGLEGMAGMFGDANQRQGDLAGWVAGKMGFGEGGQETARSIGKNLSLFPGAPSTDELRKVTTAGVGEHYKPQTTAGEYTRTVAEFVPGAAVGPGGLVRKGAMAVIPGVASETAGQLTEGTAFEPYARAGGAILGGGLAAGIKSSPAKMAAKGAPTAEAVKQTADDLYGQLRSAGIRYDADEYGKMATELAQDLRKGFRPVGTMKQAFDWADEVAKGIGSSPDFDDINALRSQIMAESRQAYRSGNDQVGKALDLIADKLDDFERGAPLATSTPIPAAQLDKMRGDARSAALKNIKQRTLQKVIDNADTYQAGKEAGIRNGLSTLLRSAKGAQLFRGAERELLLDISQGRKIGQAASKLGLNVFKGSGNSTFLPLLAAMGLGDVLGGVAAGGVAVGGTAMKAINPWRTSRALDTSMAAMRSGKLGDPKVMDALKAERMRAFARSLLSAQTGSQQLSLPPAGR
jgi:hypothetical protein